MLRLLLCDIRLLFILKTYTLYNALYYAVISKRYFSKCCQNKERTRLNALAVFIFTSETTEYRKGQPVWYLYLYCNVQSKMTRWASWEVWPNHTAMITSLSELLPSLSPFPFLLSPSSPLFLVLSPLIKLQVLFSWQERLKQGDHICPPFPRVVGHKSFPTENFGRNKANHAVCVPRVSF